MVSDLPNATAPVVLTVRPGPETRADRLVIPPTVRAAPVLDTAERPLPLRLPPTVKAEVGVRLLVPAVSANWKLRLIVVAPAVLTMSLPNPPRTVRLPPIVPFNVSVSLPLPAFTRTL